MITKANARALTSARDEETSYDFFDSPIGPLVIASEGDALTFLLLARNGKPAHVAPGWRRSPARLREARAQLAAYFAGKLLTFDLQLAPEGTPFQRSVWDQLLQIPYGDTASYIELARRLGNPSAMRAVGAANGANPLAIIVPCHRVIGHDGKLVGFGGGLPAKRWLLDHERHHAPAPLLELRP
ncbi:MAG TPA: methylated-DNA--[protein]-cysteine S-methyltransferase [Rhodanobacteraceae bacterium]|nr:methylated-DNA--[protein]-cysteine S-methyltransferase [Rhodanobacteraceae bacterium]